MDIEKIKEVFLATPESRYDEEDSKQAEESESKSDQTIRSKSKPISDFRSSGSESTRLQRKSSWLVFNLNT